MSDLLRRSIHFISCEYSQYYILLDRTECFCGNTEPAVAAKLPDPDCNHKCSGESKQICGGFFTMNIFETGIASK